jgi:hypothetical protein
MASITKNVYWEFQIYAESASASFSTQEFDQVETERII